MTEDLPKILESLADRFCERRAYSCLLRFMPAYFSPNGLTDGWEDCRNALADTRALCRDDLKPDEAKDLQAAMNIIDRMLTNRGKQMPNMNLERDAAYRRAPQIDIMRKYLKFPSNRKRE